MKKIFILACSCLFMVACGNNPKSGEASNADSTAVVDMHNAENSLDIEGTYTGTLPAADCPGIKTTLTLNNDKSFTLTGLIDHQFSFVHQQNGLAYHCLQYCGTQGRACT